MVAYHRSCLVGFIAAALLFVAGCGEESSPGEDVPAISAALTKVDDAIVAGRFDRARARLDELVATTTSAREAGDLDDSEAERILAAAAELLSALPEEAVPNPDDAPSDVPSEEVPDDEEEAEEAEEDEKEREKEQKKREREQKKENRGRGNG